MRAKIKITNFKCLEGLLQDNNNLEISKNATNACLQL